MLFLFLFNTFSPFFQPASMFSLHPLFYISPPLPSPCSPSLSLLFSPLFSPLALPGSLLRCSSLLAGVDLAMLHWSHSVKCSAPWPHFHSLVSYRLVEHASKCDMSGVSAWGGQWPRLNVCGRIYIFLLIVQFFSGLTGVTYHLESKVCFSFLCDLEQHQHLQS